MSIIYKWAMFNAKLLAITKWTIKNSPDIGWDISPYFWVSQFLQE